MASQESIAVFIGDLLLDHVMNNRVPTRRGNKDHNMAPHNCYRCRGEDSWISIAVATDKEWESLCETMGRPELIQDERFRGVQERLDNDEELDRIVGHWTKDKDAYVVMEKLQKTEIAAAPSLSSEGLFKDPHLRQRAVFRQVEHPVIGKDWVIAPPWKLSATPAAIDRHAPLLGEHNDFVFRQLLGFSRKEIEELEAEQVIY